MKPPVVSNPPPPSDLLHQARAWRAEHGLVAARERTSNAVRQLDAGRGMLEKRVMKANASPDFVFPDSIASQSHGFRQRTGIYFVLGFRQNTSDTAETLRHLAEWLKQEGWRAKVVPLDDWASPAQHAVNIDRFLREETPHVDRVCMVGFSMGAKSWVRWITEHSQKLSPRDRRKFRLALFFAGAIRGSTLSRWVSESQGLEAGIIRMQLRRMDGGTGLAQSTISWGADDPWQQRRIPPLVDRLPQLRVIQYVALPEGADGLPQRQPQLRVLSRILHRDMPWMGPFDGMVESAAQVLPPDDRTPQWIVRVYASHGMTEGHYPNGASVSAAYGAVPGARKLAAVDMVEDLMRAMPVQFVTGGEPPAR